MNALKTVLNNPQIEISTFCDQPDVPRVLHIFVERRFSLTLKLKFQPFMTNQMSLHIFHQNKNKKFPSFLKTSP